MHRETWLCVKQFGNGFRGIKPRYALCLGFFLLQKCVTKPTQAPTWSFQQGGCLWGSQSQEEWLDGEDFPVFIWLQLFFQRFPSCQEFFPFSYALHVFLLGGRASKFVSQRGGRSALHLGTSCIILGPTTLICIQPSSPKLIFPQISQVRAFLFRKRGQQGFEMCHLHSIVSSE